MGKPVPLPFCHAWVTFCTSKGKIWRGIVCHTSTLPDDFSMLNITFIDQEGPILCGVLTKFLQFMDDPKLVFTLVGFSYGVQPTEVMKALPWGHFLPNFQHP